MPWFVCRSTGLAGRNRVTEPKLQDKPFDISKWVVWEAYQRVKANKGAAGVDDVSIAEFEKDRDKGTCIGSGIACRREVISHLRSKRWKFPRLVGRVCGCSGCLLWRIGSRRR